MSGSHYRLSYGAEVLERRRTRFRLWAPSARAVEVELGPTARIPMQAQEEGWWETTVACGHGTRYRYRIDEELSVPDPASRAQDGDVHDASVVIDPKRYRWRNGEWRGRPWEEAVIYEAHVGVLGGFAGVARHLPRLKRLGVTAVELMPVNEFPGARNWGYDGVLPYAPDAGYGAPEELKRLVDRAHGLGLMVYLDVVYNHFGPDGNYLARYARPFFRDDLTTPWGEAIDFRRRPVRDFFIENALYWLHEYRFDGLRFDAVHAISERDFLQELAERIRASVGPDRRVHLILENEHNAASLLARDYDAQWNDDGHNSVHVLLTGEQDGYYRAYPPDSAKALARVLGEGFYYQGEPSPLHDGAPRGEPSAALPPQAFVFFLQNHDQVGNRAMGQRLTQLCSEEQLRAATLLLLLAPQIPLLFMGEEWGCTRPFLFFTDHNAELGAIVREGRRKEFAHFAAFADEAQREKIPDPNAAATFEASRPDPDTEDPAWRRRWSTLYRRLLKLRHAELVPRLAGSRALDADALGPAAVVARWRLGDGSVLALAVNLGKEPASIPPVTPDRWLACLPERARRPLLQGQLKAATAAAWLEKEAH